MGLDQIKPLKVMFDSVIYMYYIESYFLMVIKTPEVLFIRIQPVLILKQVGRIDRLINGFCLMYSGSFMMD